MTTSFVTVNGLRMHLTQAGETPGGRPLVLLHGLSANADMMRAEIASLARSFRVIAPDLRGHGRTDRPAGYALADHVRDMLALLDHLGLARADVMGVSMGSYIAQALAIAAPERVSRLVLVVTKASGLTSSTARYLAEHQSEVAGLTPEQVRLWLGDRMFAPQTPEGMKRAFADLMTEQAAAGLTLDPPELEAANRAMAGFDFRPDLPRLRVPTLVVSGRHDVLNPPDAGAEVARLIPGARFEVLEDSGHLATLEETARLTELVEAFLVG